LDSGGECGVPTSARFITPGNEGEEMDMQLKIKKQKKSGDVQGASGAWYSFNVGSVHVVMMNTEFDLSVGSDQYDWLANDLSSVDRTMTPWVLVGGHRQLYSCHSRNNVLADALEPLLMQNRVDLVVVGHIHLAQRTCPIVNGTCVEEADEFGYYAPVHAVVGNAGLTCSTCTGGFLPDWGTFEHGFATLHSNATNLELKFYADCEEKTDEFCRGEEPTLLHEYNMAHAYPRGY
jgi:acid phosphatase type 7